MRALDTVRVSESSGSKYIQSWYTHGAVKKQLVFDVLLVTVQFKFPDCILYRHAVDLHIENFFISSIYILLPDDEALKHTNNNKKKLPKSIKNRMSK